jgi:alpha-glutamyl/putrescinyl thymine pyrophosphorylase clade 1
MNQLVLNDLMHWIREREKVRIAKDANHPKPWTTDPIIQNYRFCNVHREDDFVTRWFALNWRGPKYWHEPNFIAAIMLGRTINWPRTMERLGFPHEWEPQVFIDILDGLAAKGEKVWTGAYMITAGPTGVRKSVWVMGNAESYFKNPPKLDPTSLQKSWETIVENRYPCVGPFIAGQVIADLKQTPHLSQAEDWWDWAPVGPGSMRGLNRVYDRALGTNVSQKVALNEMRAIRDELELADICLQDVQNCLCELDKYERVKLGQGKPRSGYNGR